MNTAETDQLKLLIAGGIGKTETPSVITRLGAVISTGMSIGGGREKGGQLTEKEFTAAMKKKMVGKTSNHKNTCPDYQESDGTSVSVPGKGN